ncbi:hypothetical protein [Clostridium sp.]|uniref:hypothetical protein n=1 Tax=Clostridium sp. TaxID=1506 RepID=UPI002FCC13D8
MIPIEDFVPKTLSKLKIIDIGDSLDIRTFKKDRKILITKISDNKVNIIEHGFLDVTYLDISISSLPKLLKEIKKREFPRSNRAHFSVIDKNSKLRF